MKEWHFIQNLFNDQSIQWCAITFPNFTMISTYLLFTKTTTTTKENHKAKDI